MVLYDYLVKRKSDGKLFYAFGNAKNPCYGISYLFELLDLGEFDGSCSYAHNFGNYGICVRRNVSTLIPYNSKEYSVIYQTVSSQKY